VDLAWGERAVCLFVQVRRFRCLALTCPRRIFAERLPVLTKPYARRTTRLADTQAHTALALGGTAGARQCVRQHAPVSRPTLLRMIRRLPLPALPPPQVVGVDDWAIRKGQTYGSIVVDLERHQAIDQLPDRTAETWAAWLKTHPGITIICRDCATTYAAGSTAGAPTATQVADRWHIVQNMRTAIEETLQQHRTVLGRTPPTTPLADNAIPPAPPSTTPTTTAQAAARAACREARYRQYQQVIVLHQQGLALAEISRQSGISVRTIQSWLAADGFPERKARTGDTSQLDPFKPYLHTRWDAGCHKATQLWRAIQAQGYAGSYRTIVGYLQPMRHGKPLHRPPATLAPATMPAPSETRYTPHQVSFLFLRAEDDLVANEQQDLAKMQVAEPALARLYRLTQDFIQMVRERRGAALDTWLEAASASGLPALQRFVQGIRQDEAAVRAGLTLPWSSGQVEGQVTRLKLLKRQMYGRAKLDLLRQRVLLAA
jgi:transposase